MLINHSNFSLIEYYLHQTSELDWVLATIVNKEGSSYRSPGAIMLINSLGQSFGLISGGCLEANLILHAKKVLVHQQSQYVEYDMREEDNYAAELGVGCKGKIGVLLQYLTKEHRDVLDLLYRRMLCGDSCILMQVFVHTTTRALTNEIALYDTKGKFVISSFSDEHTSAIQNVERDLPLHIDANIMQSHFKKSTYQSSFITFKAPIDFWIFGGGADALPLAMMAAQLGWRVTVVDHRSSYARASVFNQVAQVQHVHPKDINKLKGFHKIDAAILMTHNLMLDADWLVHLYEIKSTKYIGLLGPLERRERVESLTEIDDILWLKNHINGPAGLNIGGELPESIALSIIAQCHSVLHHRNAKSLSGSYINS